MGRIHQRRGSTHQSKPGTHTRQILGFFARQVQKSVRLNNILHGLALDQLKTLENGSVDCCITSPPYWALRDYKTPGQLGLEPTFQEYITKLVEIFNEVKRVLKRTGSCWVNIGDTYSSTSRGDNRKPEDFKEKNRLGRVGLNNQCFNTDNIPKMKSNHEVPEKSLCLIPQRFQIAMVDAGWICRNTIIWYKPNCMPSSAKDRFTVDFEYLFFFTKTQKYYFETQYEPLNWDTESRYARSAFGGSKNISSMENGDRLSIRPPMGNLETNPLGRIKRCVWKIPTQAFSEAHFAVFPPAIVETPLKACCPEYVCRKCGKAREKIVEKEYERLRRLGHNQNKVYQGNNTHFIRDMGIARISKVTQIGWNECNCNAGFDGGIVLDPFIGSGTVALVAMQNARNFIGIELSQAYIDMAMKRLEPYLLQTRLQVG